MGFKSVPVSYTVCGQKGEVYSYDPLCLSAPSGTTFTQVQFASYGTPNGGCGGYSYGGCHAGNSGGVVSGAFIGRTSGCVSPDNGTFGDPCVGTYKRLYVQLLAEGTVQVFVPVPTITSFFASPNPQSSTTGSPQYSTTLSWGSNNGLSATLTSSAGESWNVSVSGTRSITNLPQSVVGSNSPASRTYTLTVYNELNESTSSTITVQAYNDNTTTNSWTTSFNNLDPNTTTDLVLGTLSGIDMPISVSTSASGTTFSIGGAFGNPINVNAGNTLRMRTTTLAYNTDLTGVTGIYGKTNTKTIPVTVGPSSFNVNVTTKAPRVAEDFDVGNVSNAYPYTDIDLITNTPTQYLTTGQIPVNDIDIPVEIKSDNSSVQVNVNGSGWKDIRQI